MPRSTRNLMLCLKNDDYGASLERRKIYVCLPDQVASEHGLVRIIDESGEDYLYPKGLFAQVVLPTPVRRAMLTAA